jgi:sugar phosphate isomerase/epimerase
MTYGFSTLGCPMASLADAAALTRLFGLDHLEIRALNGSVDLLGQELDPEDLGGVPVSVLGSPLCLCGKGEDWEQAEAWLDLAERLGARWLRVFDATTVQVEPWSNTWDQVRTNTARLLKSAKGRRVQPIIETHSVFLSAEVLCSWLTEFAGAEPGILWDVHHTWAHDPAGTEAISIRCGTAVRHLHIKDSRSKGGLRHYVEPGKGDFPWPMLRQTLATAGLSSVTCSLEWEKLWHDDLSPLETALTEAQRAGWFGKVVSS